ncbi:MAG TPA: DEAD/DEAH box helicase, partial [Thermoplasmata archaeon]
MNEMQARALSEIRAGSHLLIVAPTGSGKTEAALFPILEALGATDRSGVRALYVTPLRALNRNLIDRIQRLVASTHLTAAVRHGDTPTSERRKQAANPPDILITTPETLQAILSGKLMQRHLKAVRYVVVDEVHQFAEDRRGIQLSVGLQRLRRIAERDFQRIGLSATVGHPDAIASLFGGEKPLEILLAPLEKRYEYRVEWPRPIDKDFETARDFYITPEAAAGLSAIDDSLDESRSTLVFVNARPLAELLGSRLSMVRQDVAVHHGSLPREERERVEAGFKGREIKGLVCIPHDEPIVTSHGVKAAKEVAVGDEVLSYDPESYSTVFRPVKKTFARTATRLVRVKHEFGLLRVTPNHPILCLGANGFTWKAASELKVGDALVAVGKVEGKKVATHTLLRYPNLFVKNSAVAALGYELPRKYPKQKVTRLAELRPILGDEDLLKLTEFSTTQTKYTFPPWVDSGLGYLLGFQKSDGDRHLRFFNSDTRKLLRVHSFLSKVYGGSLRTAAQPTSRQSFESKRPTMVLHAPSKPLIDLLSNLWRSLPLEEHVTAAFLATYLDGDGCLAVRNGRLEQIQFETFNPINREYLLFTMLAMGFKPKLWKATGMHADGFCISIAYSDDKARLFRLVAELSIKAKDAGSLNLGNKPKTYYGLGPYLKTVRQNLGVSAYRLWKKMQYSTRYEDSTRGITCQTLARLNEYLESPLLKELLQGRFMVSQVRALQLTDDETSVVNFEVEGTQTYALTGIVTHNCTST